MVVYKKTLNAIIYSVHAAVFILCSSSSFSATVTQEPAPGRGIIPIVSDHYKTMPSFYDFDQMPIEHLTNTIGRRFVMGTQSMVTRWDLKAGTKLPVHFHVNEQITRVDKGLLEIYSQGQKYTVKAGQVMVFPPNVPHEFVALKDTSIYELHTPVREDFINSDFDKKVKTFPAVNSTK